MKFTPKTEEELARESLLAAGNYPFEVLEATDQISKSGNEMMKVKLNVFGPHGEQIHVYDYLLEKIAFKLRHFAETTGLLKDYESGHLESFACVGKNGFVKLDIEEQSGYPPRNIVKDYVVQKPAQGGNGTKRSSALPTYPQADAYRAAMTPQAQSPAQPQGSMDDDIPF